MAKKKQKPSVTTQGSANDQTASPPASEKENGDHEQDNSADETLNSTAPRSVVSEEEDAFSIPDKKRKPGIVYLSSIPPQMNVALVRQFLQTYGEIERIFLQPAKHETEPSKSKKKKPSRSFTEGWVEFKKKSVAKAVAANLNRQPVGGKRRTQYHDVLWTMKYLPGFKWAHLNERLAYEKAVHEQRVRTEIAQVKREANHFVEAIEKSEKMRRLDKKRKAKGMDDEEKAGNYTVTQKPTEEEFQQNIKLKRAKKDAEKSDRSTFLLSLFGSGTQPDKD